MTDEGPEMAYDVSRGQMRTDKGRLGQMMTADGGVHLLKSAGLV